MHNAANRHALVDETCHRIGIVGRRQDKDAALLRLLNRLCGNAPVSGHDETGNALIDTCKDNIFLAVADEDNVVLLDKFFNRMYAARRDADLPLDRLTLFARDQHVAVRRMDDVTIAHAHIGEIRHAKLLEITLREVADRDDADENPLTVRHRDRPQIIVAQHLSKMTQRVVLTNDNLAVHRDVLHARIEIGNEQRLFHMEIFQRELCLLIDFPCARCHSVDPERLFQMSVPDR